MVGFRPSPNEWVVWSMNPITRSLSRIDTSTHILLDAAVHACLSHGNGRFFVTNTDGSVRVGVKVRDGVLARIPNKRRK